MNSYRCRLVTKSAVVTIAPVVLAVPLRISVMSRSVELVLISRRGCDGVAIRVFVGCPNWIGRVGEQFDY